ncbi:MAG: hypothetical protein AB1556_09020 [Bacillota bacterium]
MANRVIIKGIADLVGIGRALPADPKWVLKAKAVLQRGTAN